MAKTGVRQQANHLLLLTILLLSTLCAEATTTAALTQQQQQQPADAHRTQPRCYDSGSRSTGAVTPFPASFWLVKTVKTGSTTIASVLRQICAHYGVLPVSKRGINPVERLADGAAAAALRELVLHARNATDASEFSIITHLNYSDAKLAAFQAALDGRRPLLFTSVRHPLQRTYSHFIQAKCANTAAVLGGKIIECDRNTTYLHKLLELDNIRNRWSFVRVPSRHNLVFNYVRGNTTTAESALAQYDFVFVSERMDEALVLFMLQYGLRLQDIAYLPSKVRTGKYKPSDQMPPELNDYILTANQQDLLLWQHANSLLDARRQQLEQRCGAGAVEAALRSFQQLQAAVAAQCSDFEDWYAANGLPSAQYTYVNDEGWGWRCVRHVAQLYMEGQQAHTSATPPAAAAAVSVITR